MVRPAHQTGRDGPDTPAVNRRVSPLHLGRADAGRAILEALVGLSLIAIAAVMWGNAAVVGARAESNTRHRTMALDLATSELEQLRALPWSALAVDPSGPGAVRRFEGEPVVLDPAGLDAQITAEVDGTTFDILRMVTEGGDPGWRRLVVDVSWAQGEYTARVRLDGAALRGDGVGS